MIVLTLWTFSDAGRLHWPFCIAVQEGAQHGLLGVGRRDKGQRMSKNRGGSCRNSLFVGDRNILAFST